MADNPRYQRQNIMLAETQPLQFADIKESISASKSLQSGLDRISKFAFEQAAETAKKAGAEYGINNRPTLQQYAEAIQNNIDPETLFSEDYTIFGEAAREVQSLGLRTDLETEARKEMGKIKSVIKSGLPINKEEIESTLNGLIEGYARSLAKISPEQALKFKAGITPEGRQLLDQADEEITKRFVADNVIKTDEAINNLRNDLPDLIKYNNPAEFAIKIQTYRNTIKNHIAMLPAEYKLKFANKDQEVIDFAIMDGIATHLTDKKTFTNDYEVINNLYQGIAGDMTDYFGMLGFDDKGNSKKAQVVDMVRTRLNNLDGARKDALALQTEQDKTVFNDLANKYYETKNLKYIDQMKAMTIKNPNLGTPQSVEGIRKDADEEIKYSEKAIQLIDDVRTGKVDTKDALYKRGKELGLNHYAISKFGYDYFRSESSRFLKEQVANYVDQIVPSGNRQKRATKQGEIEDQIKRTINANEEHNKSVGKNEKPTNTMDVLEIIKEKRKKEVTARSTVNKNKQAYEDFIENKNIKLPLPTESLVNDDVYSMTKQNVMRSKYKNKDEILKYIDAIRQSQIEETEIK